MSQPRRTRQRYDHRLKELVRTAGDLRVATQRGVPRSTARAWLQAPESEVVSIDLSSRTTEELHAEVLALRQENERLLAILRLVVTLVKVLGVSLHRRRVAEGAKKKQLLRAIARSRSALPLRLALWLIGLSASRYHAWKREDHCALDDLPSCPHRSPHQLTVEERQVMRELATSREYRHVPTGTLAVLAQRKGEVFASPSTWYRFVRRYGWRRPRRRVHPRQPTLGVRASRPDQIWHIDATAIRLLNGARVYLHAVIDNFSRKILAWRVSDVMNSKNTVAVLEHAARQAADRPGNPTTLVTDGGTENVNAQVDAFLESGGLSRVLAQTEISFSNSRIESWWRSLKHQWLFLNPLDSSRTVRRLVEFFVAEYNGVLPHSAFRGQTPDEMYFGGGEGIPERLASDRRAARRARLEVNRAASFPSCA